MPDQLKLLGFNADDVTKIVIGHGHWDHAGQLMDFPNAVLYVQREELKGIEWALNYPEPHISAVNTDPGRLHAHAGLRLHPLTIGGDLRQGAVRQGRDRRRRDGDRRRA